MNDNNQQVEAMLVNDDHIVYAGKKDDVFSMKNKDTKLVDLSGKSVLPAFFDMNISLFNIIEMRLKTAKKDKYLENLSELDENYNKFDNFKTYKAEFLKLQEECLQNGIVTINEYFVSAKEFIFWKKISEQNLLKIDINCYVDIINHRSVMDDNCRSYRTYKNHLRLGGYSVRLDGEIYNKKAWLNRPYKSEGKFKGYLTLGYEHLSFLIKSSFEEKKQLVVFASGEMAVEQFLSCYIEVIKGIEPKEFYRPIINCCLITKKQIKKAKENSIALGFNVDVLKQAESLIKIIGRKRANRLLPIKMAEEYNIKYLLCFNQNKINNIFDIAKFSSLRKIGAKKVLGKAQKISTFNAMNALLKNSAFLCFDEQYKGSLENGKLASFVVLDNFDFENIFDSKILSTYICGNCEFNAK